MQPCRPDRKQTGAVLHHDHHVHQLFTPHKVATTVGRDRAALLAASTRGRSIRPPSLAYTAATPSPSHCRWSPREPATTDVSWHGANRNYNRSDTRPIAPVSPPRLCRGWSHAVPPLPHADGC